MTNPPRNRTDRIQHLENAELHQCSANIFEFLGTSEQAVLRSVSHEFFQRFNTAVFLEYRLGCVGTRSGDLDDSDAQWRPIPLKSWSGAEMMKRKLRGIPSRVIIDLHRLPSLDQLLRQQAKFGVPQAGPQASLNFAHITVRGPRSGEADSVPKASPLGKDLGDGFLGYAVSAVHVVFGEGLDVVETIGDGLLSHCDKLQTVDWRGLCGVKKIGDNWLANAKTMEKVNFLGLDSLEEFGPRLLYEGERLKSVIFCGSELPKLRKIGDHCLGISRELTCMTLENLPELIEVGKNFASGANWELDTLIFKGLPKLRKFGEGLCYHTTVMHTMDLSDFSPCLTPTVVEVGKNKSRRAKQDKDDNDDGFYFPTDPESILAVRPDWESKWVKQFDPATPLTLKVGTNVQILKRYKPLIKWLHAPCALKQPAGDAAADAGWIVDGEEEKKKEEDMAKSKHAMEAMFGSNDRVAGSWASHQGTFTVVSAKKKGGGKKVGKKHGGGGAQGSHPPEAKGRLIVVQCVSSNLGPSDADFIASLEVRAKMDETANTPKAQRTVRSNDGPWNIYCRITE